MENICIGCLKPIPKGNELYVQKKLPNNVGVVNFYTHHECAVDGKSPAVADEFMQLRLRIVEAA